MAPRKVIGLDERRVSVGALEATCANPRCDETFPRDFSPGRRRDFHSDECRRAAERDARRLTAQVEHHRQQMEQAQLKLDAYARTNTPARGVGPTAEERDHARDAISKVEGMARFLPGHQSEFAQDLLDLYTAVKPLVTHKDR